MTTNSIRFAVLLGVLALPLPGFTATTGDGAATSSNSSSSMKESVKDAAITTKVKAELVKDKQVHAGSIHVKTDNGVVTLSGEANTQAEADKAVSIAKNVSDVSSVENKIEVGNRTGAKNR